MKAFEKRRLAVAIATLAIGALAAGPVAAQEEQLACQTALSKASSAHKGLFFANDFRYLETDCVGPDDSRDSFTRLGDPFKRPQPIHEIATDGDCISLDTAGIDQLCEKINV